MAVHESLVGLIANAPRWRVFPAAVLSGAVGVLGFAPLGWYPLSLFALAGLFALWLMREWRDAPLLGFGFGLGWFGAGIHWVWYSAYVYGGTPLALAVVINFLLILVLALYPLAMGWIGRRLLRGARGVWLALMFASAWVLLEMLRAVAFSGFPWLTPGYALIDSPLAGFAPLGGVNLVTWLGLLVTAVLVLVGLRRLSWRWLLLPAAILLGGALLARVSWTEPSGETLDVALLQGNIDQADKWRPGERRRTLERYLGMTARHLDADLIIWPETALPVFLDQALSVLGDIDRLAEARGVGLLIGTPTREESGAYFNSLVGMGAASGAYHKRHLVPFGEYVPLAGLLGELIQFLDVPMSDFSTGEWRQQPLRVGDVEMSVTICFEDAFVAETHAYDGQPRLMVNVSNDAWFGDTWAPAQHLQIARMRALEAQQFMVRATNTGLSAVIDANGNIVDVERPWQAAVLRSEVGLFDGKTPLVRFGEWPWGVFYLAVLLAVWRHFRRA